MIDNQVSAMQKKFSLIELLVVVAIIGILVSLLAPQKTVGQRVGLRFVNLPLNSSDFGSMCR